MSRRRGLNELDLWLFKLKTTDTTNHLEQVDQVVGYHFRASEMNDKTHAFTDVLGGRGRQATTVQRYITKTPLEYEIGDNVSELPNPTELEKSTIQNITRKPIHKRGGKHNRTRQYVWILEVS